MENKIKPFAMRCTQEQFDDVKEELCKYQTIYSVYAFDDAPILFFDKDGVTNAAISYCNSENIPIDETWDKELFLKMAGKPQKELIGYKINPELPITAKQVGDLLNCSPKEEDGLFFWGAVFTIGTPSPLDRAKQLGVVGEGKILIPVYKDKDAEKPKTMTLTEYIQKYFDQGYDLPIEKGIYGFNDLHQDYLVVHKSLIKE